MSYSLRDLPLPVKVVATAFLLAVGAGYTSAMLQLHLRDSKTGSPMPTPADVILKFTGKKKFDPSAPLPPAPASKLEALALAPTPETVGNSMAGAFTIQDRAPKGPLKFQEAVKIRPKAQVEAERRGEQAVLALWNRSPEAERKKAYDADAFIPPADKAPNALTPELKAGDAVKIRTLINLRCASCHSKGGEKEEPALDTYAGLLPFLPADPVPPKPDARGYIKVEEPISVSALTQSTHAHLLSFAVLFSLTGLIFAMSSWPAWMRIIGGPWVVAMVFADVSLWWLARLCDDYGTLFAQGIILTGFLAGVGLFTHIAGSLFTMYGLKGRAVIGLLMLVGAAAGIWFVTNLLVPALPKPKAEVPLVEEPKPEPKKPGDQKTDGKAEPVAAAGGAIAGGMGQVQGGGPVETARKPVNELDRLLTWPTEDGKPAPLADVKFHGAEDGGMIRAFFDKDKKYAEAVKDASPAEKERLKGQRQGDLDVMQAWVRSPEPVRKAAYDANAFDAPAAAGRVTSEFAKGGKAAIKSLIDNRCATCHGPDGKQSDYPLDSYKGLSEYLKPFDAPAPKVDPIPPAEPAKPEPKAVKPIDPIPPAKDD